MTSATMTIPKRPFGSHGRKKRCGLRRRGLGRPSQSVCLGQERDQLASNSVDGSTRRESIRQSRTISPQSRAVAWPCDIRARTDGLQPRIEIGPLFQHRNDAEQLTVPIFAYRGEQERIELAPNVRRQRGVGHFVNRFCMATDAAYA